MSYGASTFAGLAITAAILAAQLRGGSVRWGRAIVLLCGVAFAGLLGAKVFFLIERGGVVWHDLGFELRSGYRYPGGLIGIAIALPLFWRWLHPGVALPRFADACALGLPLAIALGRVGCFRTGCCHGTITAVPWATRYPAETAAWHEHVGAGIIANSAEWSAPGHPLQLYFLVASLTLAAFLLWFNQRKRYDGQVALLFLLLDGLQKGALESLRFAYRLELQFAAFAMAAAAAVALLVMNRRGTLQSGEDPT